MERSTGATAREGTHGGRRPTAGWSVGLVVLALVAAGCGQIGAARDHGALPPSRPPAIGPTSSPADLVRSTPNGENQTPSGALKYKITTRKIVRTPKGPDPLGRCPVFGKGFFSDDFGAPRFAGGFHLHHGNDVFAAMGTPVVAPFEGSAVATPNDLGGLAVTVYGASGFVYNAHLSRYGSLGPVHTGDVIGYVGNTGDALGGPPHDHFEWHPKVAPTRPWVSPMGVGAVDGAVDPFPYLKAACTVGR
jgi:murein DD-endopeptidase MepM/ murein hydrolase activator NlpD